MKINYKLYFMKNRLFRIGVLTLLITFSSLINAQNQTQKVSFKLQNATIIEFI